jgi:hypothetical protein
MRRDVRCSRPATSCSPACCTVQGDDDLVLGGPVRRRVHLTRAHGAPGEKFRKQTPELLDGQPLEDFAARSPRWCSRHESCPP